MRVKGAYYPPLPPARKNDGVSALQVCFDYDGGVQYGTRKVDQFDFLKSEIMTFPLALAIVVVNNLIKCDSSCYIRINLISMLLLF